MQEATAGNPFFALELGRELVRTNTRPTPARRSAFRQASTSCSAAASPAFLERRSRPAPRRRARPADRRAARHRRTRARIRVLEALEARAQETVVELDDSSRALHTSLARVDLLRARAGLEAARRARALADAVSDAESGTPPRARRRRPDASVAEELELAAEQAAGRGAAAAGAELYELAAELSPTIPQRHAGAGCAPRASSRALASHQAIAILQELKHERPLASSIPRPLRAGASRSREDQTELLQQINER